MDDCLFCKMSRKKIPVDFVYEDEHVFVIRDINPQAPVHLLAIPHIHYPGIHDVPEDNSIIFGQMYTAIAKVVIAEGIDRKGYRLVINYGSTTGQSVDHIHVHILSGRQMQWPPG